MGQFGLWAKAPIGIFVFSEQEELLYFRLFSRNPDQAVQEYLKAAEGPVKDLKKEIIESDTAYKMLRKKLRDYAKSLGFLETDSELNKFLSDFGYALSKKMLAGVIGRDRLIMQSVNALDDMGRVVNMFQERMYEWFSLHYPELKNSKDLVEKIIDHGRRENFPNFRDSTGVALNEKDEAALTAFAAVIKHLDKEKDRLEDYVKASVKETAPNLSSVIDPILAARLIAQAGSLEKLSRMPASTIQLLGAEKALFRHLHNRGRSPKYGIIFTSAVIQSVPNESKGKAARILASKLMVAARVDYYSGRFDENIKKQMDEELKRV